MVAMRDSNRPRSCSVSEFGTGLTFSPLLDSAIGMRFPSQLKRHFAVGKQWHQGDAPSVIERVSKLFSKRSSTYNVAKRHSAIILSAKPADSWVTVHNLRQLDGGILDPDDHLRDVADDREQIIAIYDEASHPHQGDGTSGSDESENPSPDIFKGKDHKFSPFARNDIEVTGEQLNGTPPPLQVRRGSEPALNRISPIPPSASVHLDTSKRWSAAAVIDDHPPPSSTPVQNGEIHASHEERHFEDYLGERGEGSGEEKKPSSASSSGSSRHSATTTTVSRFARDSNRCSVQILSDNPDMGRWADAADRIIVSRFNNTNESMRKEPLGGPLSTPQHSRDPSYEENHLRKQHWVEVTHLIVLKNDGSPLGIHVIPSMDQMGQDQGLLVEGIEQDGRVARDGRIQVHDIIIEINDKPLQNVTFHQAQEIFKDAMRDAELKIRITRNEEFQRPVSRGGSITRGTISLVHGQEKYVIGSKVASVSSTRKVPSASLSSRTQSVMLQSNTRRLGKKLNVNLVKGSFGLGFSITTRDNPAGGEAPIYIKSILPKGAAIEEGTLQIGDRLLEVNGITVTGCSQSDVAALLRQIPVGGVASLTVSRQEKAEALINSSPFDKPDESNPPSPLLPRQLVTEKGTEDSLMFPWKQREILTFEIPVHDSERAGLGVSVKGKTSSGPNGCVDLGIFVKNVINGGAASRDGRLQQNDQLVNINGLSLLGKPNSEAMKTLRTAMSHEFSPNPGIISLTVARRVDTSRDSLSQQTGRDSSASPAVVLHGIDLCGNMRTTISCPSTPTPDYSGTSDNSDNTVIFNAIQENRRTSMDSLGCSNPVFQRLTGHTAALRNDSYYKATHDTWNASQLNHSVHVDVGQPREQGFQGGLTFSVSQAHSVVSPTISSAHRETVMIQDEYDPIISSNSNGTTTLTVYCDQPSQSSDAYISQTSLEEPGQFSRDQFGRQSISEKRHATLDAKNTDTYQRNKKAREEREKQKMLEKELPSQDVGDDSWNRGNKDIGPALGMKKSSSLESLQTMVQEITLQEEGLRPGGSGRVPRGRGCNESFRAAVDRSYDAPLTSGGSQMETLAEEESESSGSGFGRNNSRQSSVNSSADDRIRKGNKKKQGILKGLGSVFRFGKHRKILENRDEGKLSAMRPETDGPKHVQNQQSVSTQDYQQLDHSRTTSDHGNQGLQQVSNGTVPMDEENNPSRSERMHQLRAEHQRRHVERNRKYPTDDLEEKYETELKQRLEPVPPEPKAVINHLRSQSYDASPKDALGQPRNRSGYSDPHRFSHYVNFDQIQQHIRKSKEQEKLKQLASQQYQEFQDKQKRKNTNEHCDDLLQKLEERFIHESIIASREQREYQSQRCTREPSYHQRPVSNYFEYESVQAMMNHAQDSASSLPRRGAQTPNTSEPNGRANNFREPFVKFPPQPRPRSPHHLQGQPPVPAFSSFSRSQFPLPPATLSHQDRGYSSSVHCQFGPYSNQVPGILSSVHHMHNANIGTITVSPGSKV